MPFDSSIPMKTDPRAFVPKVPSREAVDHFRKGFSKAAAPICAAAEKTSGKSGRDEGALLCLRILIVHRLQMAGLLDGDRAYLRTRHDACLAEGRNYHDGFLCPLFDVGLGSPERPDGIAELLGDVPYVNGGLFSDDRDPDVRIHGLPDESFVDLLDFLDSLQWVPEFEAATTPGEVNGLVVGNVFESFTAQKENGAYYTPLDVTWHMSSSAICARIIDLAAARAPCTLGPGGTIWKRVADNPGKYLPCELTQGLPKRFVRPRGTLMSDPCRKGIPGETWRELKARMERAVTARRRVARAGCATDLVIANADMIAFLLDAIREAAANGELDALREAASGLRIVDPTCGGGAFLMPSLRCLVLLLQAISDASGEGDESLTEIAARALSRSIFGVDLMPSAVAVARVSLLGYAISLARTREEVRPLTTASLNLRCGNAVIGSACAERASLAVGAVATQRITRTLRGIRSGAARRLRRMVAEADLARGRKGLDAEFARENGIRTSRPDAWARRNTPFHWGLEFMDVLSDGGFDIVVGNPPYVEMRTLGGEANNAISAFESAGCRNLYGPCLERATQVMAEDGWMGMVVPNSIVGVSLMSGLRDVLFRRLGVFAASGYATSPASLFDGVDQRICMFLAKGGEGDTELHASRYHHWTARERPALIPNVSYHPSWIHPELGTVAMTGSRSLGKLLARLRDSEAARIGDLVHPDGRHQVVYHRSPRYWTRAMRDFPEFQSLKDPSRTRSISHYRVLRFADAGTASAVGALLCSSLFFVWFISLGNGRNITEQDVLSFPLGRLTARDRRTLKVAYERLQADFMSNSRLKTTKDSVRREFTPKASKEIIDEVDRVLAGVLGLSKDELDYVLHVDERIRLRG